MSKKLLFALLSGVLFALGLVVSGMTQPGKVIGFLDLHGLSQGITWQAKPGLWDPSLALVMGGALMVTLVGFAISPKRAKPWFDQRFYLPSRNDIDGKLVLGSVLFGIGWGLAGYCPGPGLASLLTGSRDAIIFVVAMALGMWAAKRWFSQ